MTKPRAVFLLGDKPFVQIYGPDELAAIDALVEVQHENYTPDRLADVDLSGVDIVFSGWGAPVFDDALLKRMPKLRAIFYGAGTVKYMIREGVWDRDILVTSAYVANGTPVAEFTFAQIILSLKCAWQRALQIKAERRFVPKGRAPGAFHGTKVGLVSMGAIGRMVSERLQTLDIEVLAYDPFIDAEAMQKLGAKKCELDELFATCDVVSLHTPKLDSTRGMIKEQHFRSMLPGATFINTSRGAVVDEPAMVRVLQERPDLMALLDVTDPEPPLEGSPLYTLPNVVLTPHVAGSMGRECRRMGKLAVTECERYLRGETPLHPITRENFHILA